MVFAGPAVYGPFMRRFICLSIAVVLSLLWANAQAEPVQKQTQPGHKKPVPHWHGYGFLPGYHQPPNEHVPVFGATGASRGEPDYTPQYWYNGDWHYFGRPRFLHGRYNGGSFGPCWTQTPIGPIWNCG